MCRIGVILKDRGSGPTSDQEGQNSNLVVQTQKWVQGSYSFQSDVVGISYVKFKMDFYCLKSRWQLKQAQTHIGVLIWLYMGVVPLEWGPLELVLWESFPILGTFGGSESQTLFLIPHIIIPPGSEIACETEVSSSGSESVTCLWTLFHCWFSLVLTGNSL